MIPGLLATQEFALDIHESPIHGKGVFAEQDIPAGALIYRSTEYTVTPNPIYASIQRSPQEHLLEKVLRWENHSCEPNTVLRFDGAAVQLIATEQILDGEELVCDYRTTEDSIPVPFRCNCGHCGGITIR